MIPVLAQIVQRYLPGHKIEELAKDEVGKAKEHDSVREEEMFSSLGPGDVGVADRAYNNFRVLYRQTVRGVFFVVREKERTRHKVVSRVARKALPESIVADETIRLTGTDTQNSYPVDYSTKSERPAAG